VAVIVTMMAALILTGATLFAMPKTASRRRTKHWLFGLGHGATHIALGIGGALVWSRLPFVDWPWPLPPVLAFLIYGPVSGIAASELVAVYLLIASNFRVNFNELYAAQSIVDSKSFLRLHINASGELTIYPVAVTRVCRQWTVRPDDAADQPWLRPEQPITLKLAEPPIRVSPPEPAMRV
jgi:hypothetical protein